MKAIVTALTAAVVALGGARADDKKIDPAKLIGKWELTKTTDPKVKGATVEFTKDNKLVVVAEVEGVKRQFTGTYKVDGDKLSVKLNFGDGKDSKEDSDTIQSLTDEKMVLIDKDKLQNEFTKKK